MCYQDYGQSLRDISYSIHDRPFSDIIQRASRLIHDENIRISIERASNADTLAFAA
jgi:hypothetical protein